MACVVVTGANRGIGLELVRQFAARGDEVIAACRTASPALSDLGVDVYEGADVSDAASVERFASAISGRSIDILLNNAGIFSRETLDDLNWERMRKTFEVNALGPLRVTKALLRNLKDGAKVAIVSSRVGSVGDNSSGGNYGYRMSKAAVNMAGVNLAHDLKPRGIAVVLLHPGYVKTDLTGGGGNIEAHESARGMIARIDELGMEKTGSFMHAEGYELPW